MPAALTLLKIASGDNSNISLSSVSSESNVILFSVNEDSEILPGLPASNSSSPVTGRFITSEMATDVVTIKDSTRKTERIVML